MNLRDKLRQAPPDTEAFEDAPSAPAPEAKSRRVKAAKAPRPAQDRPKLDVNRRFLLLAGAAASMTALMVVIFLSNAGSGLEEGGAKVEVVVAGEDLQTGMRLSEERLATKEVPKAYLPRGYFTEIGKLTNRVAIAPMVAGEPILEVRTSLPDPKYGIAYLLEAGERAKTISVDSASGLGGLIRPGNEVDLIATLEDPGNASRRISTPVIQKARVIAVGGQLLGQVKQTDEEAPAEPGSGISSEGTLTLAVPAAKTAIVTLLEDMGKLQVVLRATGDTSTTEARFSDAQIMGLIGGKVPAREAAPAAPKAPPPAARPRPATRVIVREVVRPAPARPAPARPAPPKPAPHKPVEVIQFGH